MEKTHKKPSDIGSPKRTLDDVKSYYKDDERSF